MKVLFIGNSHTYFNDMPATYADLMEAGTGERPDVTMLAYSWKDLEWHICAEYFTVRYNILYGGYDYCVVQQAAHPFPGYETTLKNAGMIAELCQKAGSKMIMIETWAERDHPEHQEKLSNANRDIAKTTGALLAPVATVWNDVRKSIINDDMYWKDGEHAGVYGALVTAFTLCYMTGGTACLDAISPGDVCVRDFACGEDIDFHHPHVCEDKQEILVRADEEKVQIILESIKKRLA